MKGLYRTELAILAVVAAALGIVGNVDFAVELEQEAAEKEARPQRRAHAELLCDCLKVNEGRWIRVQVVQQRDREFCHVVCIYEGGAITKGTL